MVGLAACSGGERPTLSENIVVNTTPKQDTVTFGRQAGEPAVGRVAREPGDAAAAQAASQAGLPEPAVIHVMGSVRSIADETVQFGANAEPVFSDLATVVSQGCAPTACPAPALGTWADGAIEIINVATVSATADGAEPLESHVADLQQRGLTVIGFGQDASEAIAPVIFTNGEQEIAVHAISLAVDNPGAATADTPGISGVANLDDLRESVIANRNGGRGVIVLVDWGDIDGRAPTEDQIADVQQLVDAGADAVVGHGSDFLQRLDLVNQTAVAYGLGNSSVTTAEPLRADTAIMRLEFATPGRSCLLPATAGPSGPSLDRPEEIFCG